MKCKKCEKEVSPENKFCPHCGSKLLDVCPNCGCEINDESNFCGNCGYNLLEIKGEETQNQNIASNDTKHDEIDDSLVASVRDKNFPFNLILCIFSFLAIFVTTICVLRAPLFEAVSFLSVDSQTNSDLSDNFILKIYFSDLVSNYSYDASFPDYINFYLSIVVFIFYGFAYITFSIFTIISCIFYFVRKRRLITHGIFGVIISNVFLIFFLSIFTSEFDRKPQTSGFFYNYKIQFSSGLITILVLTLILFIMLGISKLFIKTDADYIGVKTTCFVCCIMLIIIPLFTISNQYVITSKIIGNYRFSFSTPILVGFSMLSAADYKTGSAYDAQLTISTALSIFELIFSLVLLGLLLSARTKGRRVVISVFLVFSLIFHLVSAAIFEITYSEIKQKIINSIVFTPIVSQAISLNNFILSVNTPHIIATILYSLILFLNTISLFFPVFQKEKLQEYDLAKKQ